MIEAMKQALEALESCGEGHITDGGNQWYDAKLVDTAIASLRQAIREHAMYEVQRLGQEIEQEQGEPVGYLEIDDIESQREYPHNCRNVNLWYESGGGLVAVYTHPPQRTEQEPVAWMKPDVLCDRTCMYLCTKGFTQFPECATTHPPQRTWQGLTIDEREQIQQECFGKVPHHVAFAHAVEAKLKEKNT